MKRAVVPAVLFLLLLGLPAPGPALAATPTAGQSSFVPVDPVRLLDTRSGLGAARGKVGPGGTLDLQVRGSVPASATAVILNVTATRATEGTDVRVYPSDAAQAPTVSNLNVRRGVTVANLVTVKVGSDGAVRLRNQAGSVDLLADLAGYTGPDPASTFVPAAPVRLLDTRGGGGKLGEGGTRLLDVRGTATGAASGVPDNATAVVLNVTAVGPTATSDVRVYPFRPGTPAPEVSTLNTTAGRTVPNLVVVALGQGSSVVLRNAKGSVHLLADLAGWYVPGDGGSAFHPVDPVRLLDSRGPTPDPVNADNADSPAFRLGPGQTYDLVVAGRLTSTGSAVPGVATAVALNVTAVGPTASSDVRVYPTGAGPVPEVSNLNVTAGQTVPNAVVVRVGSEGRVTLRNASGNLDVIVDLAGFFLPTGDGWDISWPQCTSRGSTTSNLPAGGAFSVVGLTRGVPFTDNECFAAQWAWASSLAGEPSVYLNTNAPGVRESPDGQVWAEVCGATTPTSACGRVYGERLAQYALDRMPMTPTGGRPLVWMDVEGPYANGPFWQGGYGAAVAVNRAVYVGAVTTLRNAGYRVGAYSRAGTSGDWRNIMGDYRLLRTMNWVFKAPTADPAPLCTPASSFTGGPVVQVQVQPAESGQPYDLNHVC